MLHTKHMLALNASLPTTLPRLVSTTCSALVAKVMLFSEGFEDSKVLSRKMVQLYKLASEQLSQQVGNYLMHQVKQTSSFIPGCMLFGS